MRHLLAVVTLVVASLGMGAGPLSAAESTGQQCTDTVSVRWQVDHERVTVDAAVVEAPGCPDGTPVGIQLITDDGDVPDEPLVESSTNERATFDLTDYALRVEPVTGVRVFLEGEAVEGTVTIIIDRRFFNPAGNEQVGLRDRRTTTLEIGTTYLVAGPPDGYGEVSCDDVDLVVEDAVGEGVGLFTATAAGRHVACFQKQVGPARDDVDGTDVLGNILTRGGEVLRGGPLAMTGLSVLRLAVVGLAALGLGAALARWRGRRVDGS